MYLCINISHHSVEQEEIFLKEDGKKKGHWKAYIVKPDTIIDAKGRPNKITALFIHGRKTYPEGTKPERLVGKPVSAFNDSAIELYKQSRKLK